MNSYCRLSEHHELVVAGGCDNPELVRSSTTNSMAHLFCTHEEADTRLVLHAVDAAQKQFKRMIVVCRDTDVLVLFTYHQTTDEVWMDAGTTKKPKYIPVHDVRKSLPNTVLRNLLAYHSITGCDSTSQLSGHGKKSTWKTYMEQPDMLDSFTDMSESASDGAELFVINVYSPTTLVTSVNALRAEMFHRVGNPEKLPPTHDALTHHLKRCLHQMNIWLQANIARPTLSPPEESGWMFDQNTLKPILMEQESVPSVCIELLTCGCKSQKCTSARCTCNKNKLPCSFGCGCMSECSNPNNIRDDANDDNDNDDDDVYDDDDV